MWKSAYKDIVNNVETNIITAAIVHNDTQKVVIVWFAFLIQWGNSVMTQQ